MKPALVAAVVLALFVNFAPWSKPQGHPGEKAQAASDKHPSALPSIPPHAIQNPQSRPQSDKCGTQTKSPKWYKSPEWILVIVGFVTAFVIGWQAFESRRATEASRRSVELQKKAMEQWVETSDWGVSYLLNQKDGAEALPIQFKITNPTKFKIVLREANFLINRRRISTILFRNQLLAPGGYTNGEIEYTLDAGQVAAFRKETLRFEIGGAIRFIDAFGISQEQPFGYTCFCRSPNNSFFEPAPFPIEWAAENKKNDKAT